jgi:hypothetical protein
VLKNALSWLALAPVTVSKIAGEHSALGFSMDAATHCLNFLFRENPSLCAGQHSVVLIHGCFSFRLRTLSVSKKIFAHFWTARQRRRELALAERNVAIFRV